MIGALVALTTVTVALDGLVGLPGGVLAGRWIGEDSVVSAPPATPRPVVPPLSASPVLSPATGDTAPDPAALAKVLAPILDEAALGPRVGAVVVDVATGSTLYSQSPGTPRPPASTAKLLTATAALELIGPDARLITRVVETPAGVGAAPATTPVIFLVGAGDPSLRSEPGGGDPSVRTLARRTAAALGTRDISQVRLRFDATLFDPPTASPAWPKAYVASGVVAPVSALSVDDARVSDPARVAADTFAEELAAAGIKVRGEVTPAAASAQAVDLAAVQSRPVGALVEQMLTTSDNDFAEAFGHLNAVAAGQPATFEGGAAATLAAVRALQVDTVGSALFDGSGLARSNRVSAETLTRLLAVIASPGHPELSSVQTGLPIAAFSGTLENRFLLKPAAGAAGLVRAKTGTLTGITGLAGTVQDREGRVLAFAFLADRIPEGGVLEAPAALDRAAAALAGCGCR